MGKIYRFPFPKYRSQIDPSDRSGTSIFGLCMAAASSILSSYGIELAIIMLWFIGGLFVVGLFWENYPKFTRRLTGVISWFGIAVVICSLVYTLFFDFRSEFSETGGSFAALLMTLCSALLGALFFLEVIRGARKSKFLEEPTSRD